MFGITNDGAWLFIAFLFIFSFILGRAAKVEKEDEAKRKASTCGNRYMA